MHSPAAASPQPERATRTTRPRRMWALALVVAAIAAILPAALPAAAAPAQAAPAPAAATTQRLLPEWYQFCYDRRAVGITSGQSLYANAYADPRGVNCKYYVISWRAGFPHYTYRYYPWGQVCGQLGYRGWYWDAARRYPWCVR